MQTKQRVLQIVDDVQYATTNCFQHQLSKTLNDSYDVKMLPLRLMKSSDTSDYDSIVCTLKLRTMFKEIESVKSVLSDKPFCFYEQDPWHSYMDDSPYKGAYDLIHKNLNVSCFAVTTKWWSDYINSQNMKACFVKMWVLPEYCTQGMLHADRPTKLGFLGALHPHRKELFKRLDDLEINVNVQTGGLDYQSYLREIEKIHCYVHSEDSPFMINGQLHNLNVGLWAREIEVASRGCFSIRNYGSEYSTYINENIKTSFMFNDVKEISDIIRNIDELDVQRTVNETVEYIKDSNEWKITANVLVNEGKQ